MISSQKVKPLLKIGCPWSFHSARCQSNFTGPHSVAMTTPANIITNPARARRVGLSWSSGMARMKPKATVADITGATIPPDFQRNPRIHTCWKIQRKAG